MDRLDYYVITGNSGTGKTTTGERLAETLDTEFLEPEIMRRQLGLVDYDNKDTPLVTRKLHERIRELITKGIPAIFSRVYISRNVREESYTLIRNISEELGREVRSVLIECVCSEQEAKRRIAARPDKDELHCMPNDPRVWDRIKGYEEAINEDETASNPNFSFLQFDTEKNQLKRVIVRPTHDKAIEVLEATLINGKTVH